MNIPKNMTKAEVIEKIQKVINRIAPKYTFYGYEVEDLKQEAFIICIEALNRYDPSRPLENFLSVNLSNRLKTFVRDNFFTANASEARKRLAQPSQLSYDDTIVDEQEKFSFSYDKMELRDMASAIDKHIPASVRLDYLKILDDVYVSKQRRQEVEMVIRGILEEHGYYEEG